MKITPDIIRHEFINIETKVCRKPQASYAKISGKIIDETRNTFVILHKGKKKTIIKDLAIFQFKFSDGTIAEIDGKLLVGRPEDRLKRHVRRLW
ncbi:ribonuclease P protein subunit [Candidatus Bathyarchaeota archaeon]|nr:ribonuclease P protein subunit [Candidatus Bathyarchaeota archaeon]